MTSIWFVVPAYGRLALTAVCLRQLARTCDTLTQNGLHASAVVIADDANRDVALELGFATVRRDNATLGRRFNDGYELAAIAGVDYVVPLGSDDWIDPCCLLAGNLPDEDTIRCFRLAGIVREDGRALAPIRITYEGGVGIRVIPTALLRPLRYRPADDDRRRAIDASVLRNIARWRGGMPRLEYADLHTLQIVDWKSDTQLNSYAQLEPYRTGAEQPDPFAVLADVYPPEALAEMATVYGVREEVPA